MRCAGRLAVALLACLVIVEAARADDDETARRQRIQSMDDAQKEQLRRRLEWFKEHPDEQQRLRQLHRQIQSDPRSEQLRAVMHRYCTWLKQLPAYRRAELRELEPAERLERIKQLRKEEAERPTREDMEGLFDWLKQYVSQHESQIRQSLPSFLQERMTERDSESRRGWLAWMTRVRMGRSGKPTWATDEDLNDLRLKLSEKARKRLEAKEPKEQWEEIAGWVRHGFRHRMGSRRFAGGMPPGLQKEPTDLQKELDQFFLELPPEERDRLLSLPGDEMQRELRRLYVTRTRPGESSDRRPPRSMHGRGPGPPQRGPRPGPRGEVPKGEGPPQPPEPRPPEPRPPEPRPEPPPPPDGKP